MGTSECQSAQRQNQSRLKTWQPVRSRTSAITLIDNCKGLGIARPRRVEAAMLKAWLFPHMTEAELARNLALALNCAQSGAEVIIDRNARPVAALRETQSSGASHRKSWPPRQLREEFG